ncbi:MAG: CDP-alcohol phosphatidyltransferase family protein [Dysgonamonadaceae bacterium]
MKKHIPNLITSLNLFSGCIGCVAAFHGALDWVVFWVVLAGVFDFLDGFCSRLLKAYSSIGKELDSLADMISFGLAPSLAIFSLLGGANMMYPEWLIPVREYIPYLAFVIAVFSALRLAKFNVDERQTLSFIGLATPANALFWASYCAGIYKMQIIEPGIMFATLILIFIFSYLMISEIPMFSLKKRKLKWKENEQLIVLLAFTLISTYFLNILGIAVSVLFYISICCIFIKKNRQKEL